MFHFTGNVSFTHYAPRGLENAQAGVFARAADGDRFVLDEHSVFDTDSNLTRESTSESPFVVSVSNVLAECLVLRQHPKGELRGL
jgi:hypothetical protein